MKIILETSSETELHQLLSALTLFLNKPKHTLPPIPQDALTTGNGSHDPIPDVNVEIAADGRIHLRDFVLEWALNFGDPNAPQPDRTDLMVSMMQDNGVGIMSFIKDAGGLTRAILLATQSDNWDRRFSRLIAENITQVGSIICPPLANHLEYPWKFDN